MKQTIIIAVIVVINLFVTATVAETVILSNPVIADVTDRSLSLIWTTDRVGELFVEVYSDQAGTQLISDLGINNYGVKTGISIFQIASEISNKTTLENAIQSKGIAKVVISGLQANTEYYLKYGVIDNVSLETTTCPDSGVAYCLNAPTELMIVRTETKVVREANITEIILNDVALHLDVSAEQGELILISSESASFPTSAIVGDAVPVPYALIDFNNYFDLTTNASMVMRSGEASVQGNTGNALNIVHYRGLNGLSNQLAIVDVAPGTGSIAGILDRNIGDCNADGKTDGYDNLLLDNYLSGVFIPLNDKDISFHKFLCNLTLESGLNYVDADVMIDEQDLLLHNELLVGRQNTTTLPVMQ